MLRHNGFRFEFTDLLLNRVPIKRTCEILGIGNSTYYKKLEFLYQRCLEFLEKHETEALRNRQFNEMYLDTDYMMYYLNNFRHLHLSTRKQTKEDAEAELGPIQRREQNVRGLHVTPTYTAVAH